MATETASRRLLLVGFIAAALIGCTSPRPTPTAPGSSGSVPPATDAPTPTMSGVASTPPPTASAAASQTTIPGTAVPSASAPPATESVPPQTDAPATPPPSGAFDPNAITLGIEPFASGLKRITFVTHAGDGTGTLYALEQAGRVVVVTPGDVQSGQMLLNIGDRVSSGGERGLLGIAFHPEFESNGRFFVNYTNVRGDTTISEFTRGADGIVDAAAERVLLTVQQPFANHNGGMLAFGPDGYLYIALGDGGSAGDPYGNAQNRGTLLGKLLRIDVDSGEPYGIPADNPFADGANGTMPEIWALGLRNPWRFSFDRQTGGLFIADVGQNQWEEINAEPAGQGGRNYGWDIMEADQCYENGGCSRQGLTLPVAVYSHDEGCSVTGGYVYRGAAFPQLFGGYVFADFCSGRLWAINADRALAGESVNRIELGQVPFTTPSFGEDEAGELYVVNHDGAIHRLVATPR